MKYKLIIETTAIVIFIIAIGYLSNSYCESEFYYPRYEYASKNSKSCDYKINKLIPFYIHAEYKMEKNDGKLITETSSALHFFAFSKILKTKIKQDVDIVQWNLSPHHLIAFF